MEDSLDIFKTPLGTPPLEKSEGWA